MAESPVNLNEVLKSLIRERIPFVLTVLMVSVPGSLDRGTRTTLIFLSKGEETMAVL